MIDNALFPSIRSVDDYVSASGKDMPYAYESQSTVYIQELGEATCEQYRVACTLDSMILLDADSPRVRSIVTWMKFCKVGVERNKKLLNSMRVDGDDFLFNMGDDARGFLNFVEQRNALVDAAIADGLDSCCSMAVALYGSGLATPAYNLVGMIPEAAFVYPDAHRAMLWRLGRRNKLFTEYIGFDEEDIKNALAIIADGDNRLIFDQIGQPFSEFIEILKEDYSVNEALAPLTALLVVERGAVAFFADKWTREYDPAPKYVDAEGYIAACVESNRISASSARDISILTYYVMSRDETSYGDYRAAYEDVLGIVGRKAREGRRSSLRERLFSSPEREGERALTIDDVDLMGGTEFESAVCALFKAMGYAVHATRQSGDQGIDVIAEKGAVKIGIQAKCYASAVGNGAVQEAVAGKVFYGCGKAMVVTNSTFTKSAVELAAANGVILWGRDILMQKLADYPVTV